MSEDSKYWADYYEVTAERPAWQTVRKAIDLFAAEDETAGRSGATPVGSRLAVDLGCGAGRDSRQLLRAGWRVVAVDREPGSRTALEAHVEPEFLPRLQIVTADLADVDVPPCDLVNADLCLPFLEPVAYHATWQRIVAALAPGARFSAMLFGDRDGSAGEPGMTCLTPERIEADLAGFEIEFWSNQEEDTQTALGEPHHFHLVEFVARRAG
jgi:SAM-dependent methyltransferase